MTLRWVSALAALAAGACADPFAIRVEEVVGIWDVVEVNGQTIPGIVVWREDWPADTVRAWWFEFIPYENEVTQEIAHSGSCEGGYKGTTSWITDPQYWTWSLGESWAGDYVALQEPRGVWYGRIEGGVMTISNSTWSDVWPAPVTIVLRKRP